MQQPYDLLKRRILFWYLPASCWPLPVSGLAPRRWTSAWRAPECWTARTGPRPTRSWQGSSRTWNYKRNYLLILFFSFLENVIINHINSILIISPFLAFPIPSLVGVRVWVLFEIWAPSSLRHFFMMIHSFYSYIRPFIPVSVPVTEMVPAAEGRVLSAHVHLQVLEEVVVLVAWEGDQHTNRA